MKLAIAWAVVRGGIELSGNATCPGIDDVAVELRRLLPETDAPDLPQGRASLEPVDGGVRVLLADERGRSVGERFLASEGSCLDAARATAVVLAAWAADLSPRHEPTLPAEEQRLVVAPPRPSTPIEVEAGATAAWAGDSLAPGAVAAVSVGDAQRPVALRLSVSGTAPRDLSFASGVVRWMRPAIAAEARWRLTVSAVEIDARAGAGAALLSVWGVGYDANRGELDLDPALTAGLRAAVRIFPTSVWVGLGVTMWPRRQEVVVTGVAGSAELPRWEVSVALGLAFARR